MAGQQRAWVVTVAWPESGQDLDLYVTLSAGGQTTSGIGWNNGSQTPVLEVNSGGINGTFYAKWGGDNTSRGGSETITIYFSGTLPAGNTQVATVTPHCNYYHKLGSGDDAQDSTGAATVTVDEQSGQWTVSSPSTHYGTRATESDPSVNVPLYADGGSPTPFPDDLVIVTLNADGGSVDPSKLYYLSPTSSTNYGTLPTPTLSGGTFLGWFTASSGGTQVADASVLASLSSHTLYAHWSFHVELWIFDAYASRGSATLNGQAAQYHKWVVSYIDGDFEKGTTIRLVASASQNYEFAYWDDVTNAAGLSPGTPISGAGATFDLVVTKSGYYTPRFNYVGPVTVNASVYLADYSSKLREYTDGLEVFVDEQGPGLDVSKVVPQGTPSVTLRAAGFGYYVGEWGEEHWPLHFKEWRRGNYPSDSESLVSTDATYTITPEPHVISEHYHALYQGVWAFSVRVDPSGGGSLSYTMPFQDLPNFAFEGTSITVSAVPNSGYRLISWTRTGQGMYDNILSRSASFTFQVNQTESLNDYTAHFQLDGPDITFDWQGAHAGTSWIAAEYGRPMPSITPPYEPYGYSTRLGYSFEGYFTEPDGEGVKYYNADGTSARNCDLSSATTLYAKWTPYTVIVSINNQGGDGVTSVTATYDELLPTITPPTRPGYTFAGCFYSASNRSQKFYNADGTSDPRGCQYYSAFTIYSHWDRNYYIITLDPNGGLYKGSASPSSVSQGFDMSRVGTIAPATRDGYVFDGWWTEPSGGTQVLDASNKTIEGTYWSRSTTNPNGLYSPGEWIYPNNATFYAHWTPATYTVTLDKQSIYPQGDSSVTATYASPMPTVSLPRKPGYAFVGYFSSTGGGGTRYYNSDGTSARVYDLTSNTTLYAFWIIKTDLLVNSSSLGAPVQLVYDPATNLLVADY